MTIDSFSVQSSEGVPPNAAGHCQANVSRVRVVRSYTLGTTKVGCGFASREKWTVRQNMPATLLAFPAWSLARLPPNAVYFGSGTARGLSGCGE
ncbi:hypothetical protein GCM10023156_58020 [Novipirellula rosea]|uniref:Uncharacterized protein n=1 Tax=Novipirellula rosea TaxID=1031540 RepID=A0ABP8NLP5_9BACT